MFKTLIPTLSILTSIVLYNFFIQPMYDEVKVIRAEKGSYEETTAKYQEFNSQLQNLLTKKNAIGINDRERLDKMIPENVDLPRLLVDLEEMARRNGLLFGNIDASSEGTRTGNSRNEEGDVVASISTQEVKFEVLGNYSQFKSFLHTLESSLVFMEITEIRLSASTNQFQQYAVTIETYALKNSIDNENES
ncbi:MAG TPA: type 4a pilus biogenesis protein PilO [Candidatus Paceibacterota bacterium]|nr:type 4a pilus biogenesis protein PilO [Candidatus Paceibacterota bacterium]